MIILKRSVNKGKKSNLTLHSWVMINIFATTFEVAVDKAGTKWCKVNRSR
jgi:ABC-type transport system involved in Fe-S cluster assembly fused permease/ATPase subunit